AAATALWLGVADDDELLAQTAFELDPVGATPRHVEAAGTLADNAFQRHGAGALDDIPMMSGKCFRETQQATARAAQGSLEFGASSFQGHVAQVFAVEKRCIEQVVDEIVAAADVEGVLQLLKVRQALLVERHDLTVQPAVAQAQFGQSLGLLRQALRPVMPIASKQAHLTAADPRQNA